MWRLIGILVTVLFAATAAVLTWPHFFRVDDLFPIAQIVALRGPIALAFAAIFVVSLLLMLARRTRGFFASIAIVAILAAVANAGILAIRGLGSGELPERSAESIRVMSWNTAGQATDAETIARAAIEYDADIVSLPETTIETGEQVAILMRELGSPMWAHHERFPGWDANSTTLLISPDLGDYAVVASTADGAANTSTVPSVVAMPVDGDGPIVVAVHAVAPRPDAMEAWRDDLRWIADQCAGGSVIMAGDFNATLDHLARYANDGHDFGACNDAARATGTGGVSTWPTDLPLWLGSSIDHVISTDSWVAEGSVIVTTENDSGSDHRPVVVQLAPADE